MSATQVDRLGERLCREVSEKDLRLLDDYRRTFGRSYDVVVRRTEEILGSPVSGRPAKSTTSVVEKLARESVRLSQMQDIAGCRVLVADEREQDRAVLALKADFSITKVIDRRIKPSHGYRAVHVIVEEFGKPVEIQIRTPFQHVWAELSEKFADFFGSEVKYGGGPPEVRGLLDGAGELEVEIQTVQAMVQNTELVDIVPQINGVRANLISLFQRFIRDLERMKRERDE